MTICAIRGGHLGDFILTLPALAALRERFPAAWIVLCAPVEYAALALAGKLIDEIWPMTPHLLPSWTRARGEARPRRFERVVAWVSDVELIERSWVFKGSQILACPASARSTSDVPATRVFLEPLAAWGVNISKDIPQLSLRSPRPAEYAVALHPGSRNETKCWPEDDWTRLIQGMKQKGLHFLLCGTERERTRLEHLQAELPDAEMLLNLPLLDLARRLAGAAGFIGHDSGPTHLAAALGTPTICLWSSARREVWAPRGEHVAVIEREQREEARKTCAALGTEVWFRSNRSR